jgi:hypothetical protein
VRLDIIGAIIVSSAAFSVGECVCVCVCVCMCVCVAGGNGGGMCVLRLGVGGWLGGCICGWSE